jgi:hypothetical protein
VLVLLPAFAHLALHAAGGAIYDAQHLGDDASQLRQSAAAHSAGKQPRGEVRVGIGGGCSKHGVRMLTVSSVNTGEGKGGWCTVVGNYGEGNRMRGRTLWEGKQMRKKNSCEGPCREAPKRVRTPVPFRAKRCSNDRCTGLQKQSDSTTRHAVRGKVGSGGWSVRSGFRVHPPTATTTLSIKKAGFMDTSHIKNHIIS